MTFTEILEFAIKSKGWLKEFTKKCLEHKSDWTVTKIDNTFSIFSDFGNVGDSHEIAMLQYIYSINDVLFDYDSDFLKCWFGESAITPGSSFTTGWGFHQRQLLGLTEKEVCEYLEKYK